MGSATRQLKELLSAVDLALEGQRSLPQAVQVAVTGEPFRDWQNSVIDHFPWIERSLLKSSLQLSRGVVQAINACRQTRQELPLEWAFVQLTLAGDLIDQTTAPVLRWLGLSTLTSARALVQATLQNWEEARADLERSNQADCALLALGSGYAPMHLHRLGCLHNLARLQRRRDQQTAALTLACDLMNHLCGEPAIFPLSGPWHADLLLACPSDWVAGTYYQIAGQYWWWVSEGTPLTVAT